MNKEEKIKEAWVENYPPSGTDENGWSNDLVNYGTFDVKIYEFIGFLNNAKIRPRILKGIETNNGWIKIESEEDLPKSKGDYWVIWDGKIIIQYWCLYNSIADIQKQNNDWMKIITHYQPIEKPKPPIYYI